MEELQPAAGRPRRFWTRNRLGGAFAMVWGGGAVLNRLLSAAPPPGNEAYAAGQTSAVIFLGILAVVGLYYLIKG